MSMPAHAQEFSLLGGGSRASSINTYTWAFSYQEGLGKHFATSSTWLNEGHIPNHHRDGQIIQLWARVPVGSPQFVLQAGLGPYRYFDTTTAEQGGSYSDVHGWGVVYGVRASWYASNRWVTQLQVNRVHVPRGPDSAGVMLGVGYQLDAPNTPGPRDRAARSPTKPTNNQVAFASDVRHGTKRSASTFASDSPSVQLNGSPPAFRGHAVRSSAPVHKGD
ncbi:hypothetical protein AB4Y44_13915 [Paraburkholderia sp. BR10937]|uniref:hypothetical protein n=1 Tax=Paraburkholderia sp. BR10937 TaxID=3236994 RepID=UPI0034D35CED